jgi:cytoskeletal protein CcmA (bactofilin family)
MFSKDSKPTGSTTASSTAIDQPIRTVPRNATPAIISADLRVVGDMASAGDIQIDGQVEGDIQSRALTVGEGAHVKGSISAESVRVCGMVTGEIKASTVTLDKTAKVIGDIMNVSLAIEPGAFFEGHCRRLETAPKVAGSIGPAKDKDRSTETATPAYTAVS